MKDMRTGILVGGILLAVAAFLPWATAGFFSVAGTSGDGVLTLAGGVVVAALALSKREGRAAGVLVTLIGAFSVWVGWNVFSALDSDAVGTGVFLTLIAGVGLFFGGLGMLKAKPTTPAGGPVEPVAT